MAQSSAPHDGDARTPFLTAALRVFDLSLGEMLWSRRTILLLILAVGPVALTIAVRILSSATHLGPVQVNGVRLDGAALFGLLVWTLFIRFVVPVLGVFYGTGLIADEVDDKTITYLFVRPIPRGAVLVGKYLAYLACAGLITLPAVMISYFVLVPLASIPATFPSLVVDLAVILLGLAVYGALFAWVGAFFRRPLILGLVFVFGWEQVALLIPGYLRQLTIAYYLQALVPQAMPQDSTLSMLQGLFRTMPTTMTSLGWLAVFWAGFLWLAARTVAAREYILEP
ncbi:MAG: ABC transporter permease subunit [Acidobacteriota bacterium]|nr:ABC transporter permease subunit [Acidobacteriota bacterium]